jgi:Ca2+-binding RTX toxin-like protein
MAEIANSTFLDLTGWRQTTATTVADAYGFDPDNAFELPAGQSIVVGLMLDRAEDPTALLQGNWASRQTALSQMAADGTLWTNYGADPSTYAAVYQSLQSQSVQILDGGTGWTTSAESRTIWLQVDAQQFQTLFGQTLMAVPLNNGQSTLVYWDGGLTIDDPWADDIAAVWVDRDTTAPSNITMPGTELPQGPQSPGNGLSVTGQRSKLYPGQIADLYDFPLTGSDVKTATVGLLEPFVGIQLDTTATPNDQLLETLTQRVDAYRQGSGITTPADIYAVVPDRQSFSHGTAGERSLDLGVVTSASPNSTIGIYGGPQNAQHAFATFQSGIWDTVNNPEVLSSSWSEVLQAAPGSPFQRMYAELYTDAALRNISYFTAAGDSGSNGTGTGGVPGIQFGQSSPYIVTVGGTSITLASQAGKDPTLGRIDAQALASDPATLRQLIGGGLKSLPSTAPGGSLFVETVWNEYVLSGQTLSPGYTGKRSGSGGVDPREEAPGYQTDYGLSLTGAGPYADKGRGIPDVSALAGGNLLYTSPTPNLEGVQYDLGTSAATPLWAALAAQISTVFNDQGLPSLGYFNDLLYAAAAIAPGSFNDVTIGNNTSTYTIGGSITSANPKGSPTAITPTGYGYQAGPDYDLVTGLGTPDGLLLARSLTAIAHAQMSSGAPALLDGAGFASAAAQHLLVQPTLQRDGDFAVTLGGTATDYAGTATNGLAWTSTLAQKAMQADFDPALVRLFDGAAQSTPHDLAVADATSLAVTLGGSTVTPSRAAMTSPFGFVDYQDSTGNGLRLARAVAVAQTAGGADDQQAVVRLRQNTDEAVAASFYRVDDLDGTIGGLAPGQAGYAEAAAGRLYATVDGDTMISGPGDGYYKQVRLAGIDADDLVAMRLTSGGHDFYGFSAANESAGGSPVTHLWNYGLNTWGWESTYGGGDQDYNDLVVQLDFTSASGSGWLVQDTSTGGDGDDVMYGNDEANRLTAGPGSDTIQGAGGRDTLFGHLGDDLVLGQDGDDFVGTGAGNDFGSGGFGNDEVHGEAGDDLLFGDDGNDGVYGEDGDDLVYGGTGHDYLTGDAGQDQLYGQDGDDRLFGGEGGDNLSGGAGADTLDGGAGSDLLFGNSGDDVLTGGAGADVFGFGAGDGRDRVTDFVTGGAEADVIAFNGGVFADFAGVLAASRQDGADVVIAYGSGDALTLQGVQLGALSAATFTVA